MSEHVIGIIYNQPAPAGALFCEASQDVLAQVEAVENSLNRLRCPSVRIPFTRDLAAFVGAVKDHRVNRIFNLCETVDEDARLNGHPAAVFELLGIPFTGSPAMVLMLSTDKLLTQRLLQAAGIPTPGHVVYDSAGPLCEIGLKFPVIIKPQHEDASIGITQESIVGDQKILEQRVQTLFQRFGPLLIEEYIAGREFNVSLLGDPTAQVLPPAEIVFEDYPDNMYPILDYSAKWDPSSFEYQHSVRKFPDDIPVSLRNRMEAIALNCFRLLMLRDYGRVDLRMDADHHFYVLEVNANPCLSPDAGFTAAIEKSGLNYDQMVQRFLKFMDQRAVLPC